ncbi:MAG: M28 family metallopeptidase [Acidobacteria bacterium]|nr:M28 family metallopeptidase [Acidobacteriota bacterium]
MQNERALLFCGILFSCGLAFSQPDYQRHATSLKPAPPDPAIARALASITAAQIDQTVKALVSFGTRNTLTSMDSNLPSSQGINAAADWIAGQFRAISQQCGGCLEVKRDTFVADPASGEGWAKRIPKPTKITNVYAVMHGSDPERAKQMVLVTGHYDSINSNVFANWSDTSGAAPGANDDASGVAVSIACARALSKIKFPSTIVFVAVAAEEQGLVGSGHLARLAKSEGWQLEAVLNNDIVGGNTTPGDTLQLKDRVRVFSEGVPVAATPQEQQRIRALGKESDSPSREVARAVAEADRTYFAAAAQQNRFGAFLVDRPDRYLRGGDHSSFNREGFAAVRFTEWREDFNHQHKNVVRPATGSNDPVQGDLPEFVDFKYVAQVARLNAATLATLAFAPGVPQKVEIEAKNLGNGTTLTWEGPASGGVAHYEVLWRETTAPDWQYVKEVAPTGGQVSVSLPISKDNVIFGVRAIDARGHRGLVVVP